MAPIVMHKTAGPVLRNYRTARAGSYDDTIANKHRWFNQ